MLAALLLALGSQQTFDVHQPAAIGEVMARRLSDQFGVRIVTDESLSDIPLIFDVKDVTFEQFRAIAAEGLDAEWKQDGDAWILFRSKDAMAKEEARFQARRSDEIRQQIRDHEPAQVMAQDKLEELATSIKLASDEDLMDMFYQSTVVPDELIGQMVMDALGRDFFADMPIDQRKVYTSDGRNRTKTLPILKKIADLVSEQSARAKSVLERSGALARLEQSAAGLDKDWLLQSLGIGDANSVVLEVLSSESGVGIAVSCFDAAGRNTVYYYDGIYVDNESTSDLPQEVRLKPVQLSQATQAMHDELAKVQEDEQAWDKYFDVYLNLLEKMPETDPLQFDASDYLFNIAAAIHRPLAGRLSDDLISANGYMEGDAAIMDEDTGQKPDKLNLQDALARIDSNLQVAQSGSLLKVEPELPKKYQTVFPRKAIAAYVRANRGKALIDTSRVGSLAVAPQSYDATNDASSAFIVHGADLMYRDVSLALFATWAGLSESRRFQAASAQGINLSLPNCSDLLRFEFESAAVNSGQWSMFPGTLDSESEDGESNEPIDDWLLFDTSAGCMDRLQVNLRTRKDAEVRMLMPGTEGSDPWGTTAESLAELLYESEQDKDQREWIQQARFVMDDVIFIELRYNTPIGVMNYSSSVVTGRGQGQGVPLQQLPAAFLRQVNAALADLRRSGGGLNRAS